MRVPGFILCLIVAKVNGFFHRTSLVSTKRYRMPTSLHVSLHLEQADAEQPYVHSLKDQLVVAGNTASTLRNLIHFGDEWSRSCNAATEDDSSQRHSLTQSQYERVTGCTSTVEIKTSVAPASNRSSPEGRAILIEGKADSRVTQGMLAVLCKVRVAGHRRVLRSGSVF
jgi:sulfur transfer protein SufE